MSSRLLFCTLLTTAVLAGCLGRKEPSPDGGIGFDDARGVDVVIRNDLKNDREGDVDRATDAGGSDIGGTTGARDAASSVGQDTTSVTGGGGAAGFGGTSLSGGVAPSGGVIGSGGTAETVGTVLNGGAVGSGGMVISGGVLASGGHTAVSMNVTSGGAGATGGAAGRGGASSTGGAASSGGTSASSGKMSSGGEIGSGGSTATAAGTCDTGTNQCVGCVSRNDCSGACQSCTNGVCIAVTGRDDRGFCDGTCDSAGACKKRQGQTCQKTADCADGKPCVDGYCCNTACDGQCESCSTSTSKGICVPTTLPRTPCAGGSSACAGICDGTAVNRRTCSYPGSSTICQTANCSGKVYQATGTCSGDGGCLIPATRTCSYVCSAVEGCIGVCNLNEKQCSLTGVPQQCDSNGRWQNLTPCLVGQVCSGAGSCGCPQGTQTCGTSCCTSEQYCDTNACRSLVSDHQPCTSATNCSSGVCSPYYADGDFDGFGDGTAEKFCGSTPPSGYATRGGDCCDSNPSINPGVVDYFVAQTACNGTFTWDYNCNGSAEKQPERGVAATCVYNSADGTCVYVDGTAIPNADCGQPYSVPSSCSQVATGVCNFMGGANGGNVVCH